MMNNSKAIVMEVENIFKEESKKYNLSSTDMKGILDNYFTVQINTLPQYLFVIKDKEATSYKPYNIIINFKGFLKSVFETLLTGIPEKPLNIILTVIGFICNITKHSKIHLDSSYAALILYLHKKNAYEFPIAEENVYEIILSSKSDDTQKLNPIHMVSYLQRLKIIEIEEGMIRLKEKVVIAK